MKMRKQSVLLLLLALFLFSPAAFSSGELDQEEAGYNPAPGSVRILDVAYAGEGCPVGSLLDDISPDNEVITLFFSQFNVTKTPEYRQRFIKKMCQLKFMMEVPPGWSHAVFSLNVQGYADLQEGLVGFQNLAYSYADGRGRKPLGKMTIQGPFADDYVRTEQIPATELVWSSCRENRHQITLISTLGIEAQGPPAQGASGMMTMDVMENTLYRGQNGYLSQQMAVLWKRCENKNNPRRPNASYVALCPLQLTNNKMKEPLRTMTIKARAKTPENAIRKAEIKAANRCLNQRRGGRGRNAECRFQSELCQVAQL